MDQKDQGLYKWESVDQLNQRQKKGFSQMMRDECRAHEIEYKCIKAIFIVRNFNREKSIKSIRCLTQIIIYCLL